MGDQTPTHLLCEFMDKTKSGRRLLSKARISRLRNIWELKRTELSHFGALLERENGKVYVEKCLREAFLAYIRNSR